MRNALIGVAKSSTILIGNSSIGSTILMTSRGWLVLVFRKLISQHAAPDVRRKKNTKQESRRGAGNTHGETVQYMYLV
jgi:hypothetical protein